MSSNKNCNKNCDRIVKRIEEGQVKDTNVNTGNITYQQVSMHNQCTTLKNNPKQVKSVIDKEQLKDVLPITGNEQSKHVSIIPSSSPITAPNISQQVENNNKSNKIHAT